MNDMQSAMKLLKVIHKHVGDGDFRNWAGKLVAIRTGKTLQQFREANKVSSFVKGRESLSSGMTQGLKSPQKIRVLALAAARGNENRDIN